MTAQIGDIYTFKGDQYSIVKISEPINFHPSQYGLNPIGRNTACWAGYWCQYDITEKGIFLEELFVNDANKNYPKINGRGVSMQERMGHKHYKKLHEPIIYTGKILVGSEFLHQYYIHMGYQKFWSYKKLTEFVFENGKLIQTNDYSDIAAKIRENFSDKEAVKKIYLESKDRFWWMG